MSSRTRFLQYIGNVELLWHFILKWSSKKKNSIGFVIVPKSISRKRSEFDNFYSFLHFAKLESKSTLSYCMLYISSSA